MQPNVLEIVTVTTAISSNLYGVLFQPIKREKLRKDWSLSIRALKVSILD